MPSVFVYLLHCRNVISTKPLGVCMNTMGGGVLDLLNFVSIYMSLD